MFQIHPSIFAPQGSMENIPPGYEAVSLIEALNGPHPRAARPAPAIASPDTDTTEQVNTMCPPSWFTFRRETPAQTGKTGKDTVDDILVHNLTL